jgi:flagellar biosynthesis/type III secretory pathway chaperone
MLEVLEREREALRARALPEIQRAAGDKQRIAETLAALFPELLATVNLLDPARRGSPPAEVLRQAGHPDLAEQWRELSGLLRQCRRGNEINGAIAQTGRRFAQQLLDLIRGVPAGTGLYGRSGETRPLATTGILASA